MKSIGRGNECAARRQTTRSSNLQLPLLLPITISVSVMENDFLFRIFFLFFPHCNARSKGPPSPRFPFFLLQYRLAYATGVKGMTKERGFFFRSLGIEQKLICLFLYIFFAKGRCYSLGYERERGVRGLSWERRKEKVWRRPWLDSANEKRFFFHHLNRGTFYTAFIVNPWHF